jgi:hypothetical protein
VLILKVVTGVSIICSRDVAGGPLQTKLGVNERPFAYGVLGKREEMEGNGGAEALRSDRCGPRVGNGLEGKEIEDEEREKEWGNGDEAGAGRG